ncbi:MAG: electron transfer flavoprotein subunit beta [Dehalococcoidia bacterium]
MKILVCIKQVLTLGDEVAFNDDGTDVDRDYCDSALNEWDTFSTEEAVQIKERRDGNAEVVVVTVGDDSVEPALRRCLAMGADRAVRVEGLTSPDPLSVAFALADVARAEQPDLILCGVQSSDSVQASTGSALGGYLDWPLVAVVTRLELNESNSTARVMRELEGGRIDIVEVDLPAVITVQSGINAPRYATFRAIKQADRKEITILQAAVAPQPAYRVRRMAVPSKGGRAEMLGTHAAEIADRMVQLIKEATK